MKRIVRLLAVVAVVAMLAGACGGDEKVGTGVRLDPGSGEGGGLRDPTRTTTTLSDALEQAAGTNTTVATSDTAPTRSATTTTAPQNLILIQDDDQGHFFDPLLYQAPVGQAVTWRNVGKVARQLVSDGLFSSPEIPPGGEFVFTFTAKGTFDYRDSTRPYATSGRVQVY